MKNELRTVSIQSFKTKLLKRCRAGTFFYTFRKDKTWDLFYGFYIFSLIYQQSTTYFRHQVHQDGARRRRHRQGLLWIYLKR